jgi:hypothetical protein
MAGQAPAAESQLPNLTPKLPDTVEIALTPNQPVPPVPLYELAGPPHVLAFGSGAHNIGDHALDILGVPDANPLTLTAEQCVAWQNALCTERRPAGTVEWHQAHAHWHFQDFELYELRALLSDGTPDFSPAGLVTSSRKASFCLEDSGRSDEQIGIGLYNTCSGLLQGISPGFYDFYDAATPGQQLVVEGLADGHYALVITVDPTDRLVETDETDNQGWVVVALSSGGTIAEIVA